MARLEFQTHAVISKHTLNTDPAATLPGVPT